MTRYVETGPGESPNLGRINNNTTNRSLASSFYGEFPPSDFTTADGVSGPFAGMLWNSSNVQAPGIYMYVPGSDSGSIHGDDWTRIGVANRKVDSYTNLINDVSNGRFEVGELVCVINSDTNHTANNSLYFISSNTRNESAIVNVLSSSLTDDSVLSIHIAPNAINSSKIQDGAITTAKVRDGAITTNKVGDGQITTTKLADNSITTAKIPQNAIGSSEIAPNAVGQSELASSAVQTSHIVNNAITSDKIADSGVTNPKILNATIQGGKLVENTITPRELNVPGNGTLNQILVSNGGSDLKWEDYSSFETHTYSASNTVFQITDAPNDFWRMEVIFEDVVREEGSLNGRNLCLVPTANAADPVRKWSGNHPIITKDIPTDSTSVTQYLSNTASGGITFISYNSLSPSYLDIRRNQGSLLNITSLAGAQDVLLCQISVPNFNGFRLGSSGRFPHSVPSDQINNMGRVSANVIVRYWRDA